MFVIIDTQDADAAKRLKRGRYRGCSRLRVCMCVILQVADSAKTCEDRERLRLQDCESVHVCDLTSGGFCQNV